MGDKHQIIHQKGMRNRRFDTRIERSGGGWKERRCQSSVLIQLKMKNGEKIFVTWTILDASETHFRTTCSEHSSIDRYISLNGSRDDASSVTIRGGAQRRVLKPEWMFWKRITKVCERDKTWTDGHSSDTDHHDWEIWWFSCVSSPLTIIVMRCDNIDGWTDWCPHTSCSQEHDSGGRISQPHLPLPPSHDVLHSSWWRLILSSVCLFLLMAPLLFLFLFYKQSSVTFSLPAFGRVISSSSCSLRDMTQIRKSTTRQDDEEEEKRDKTWSLIFFCSCCILFCQTTFHQPSAHDDSKSFLFFSPDSEREEFRKKEWKSTSVPLLFSCNKISCLSSSSFLFKRIRMMLMMAYGCYSSASSHSERDPKHTAE